MAELPPLREVISKYGLAAKKSLGQNFLLDLNLTGRIARAAGSLENCTVLEVGPGPGGLTRALLDNGARRVIAIERDSRSIEALKDVQAFYPGRLEVIEGDALKFDLADLPDGPVRIVANLPYNIGTLLLIQWLEHVERFESLTLMFQREVGDRLTAPPGDKNYGRLSVLAQRLCEVDKLFSVDRNAFVPPPKVYSSIIGFRPRKKPLAEADAHILEAVTRAGFGQRRKMLRSSLKSLGVNAGELCEAAGIDPTDRAEKIDIGGWCALARVYEKMAPAAEA
jgi:16S rRNA (adenine1518-N6/adenine1519-N6)-dimethyltransferase